MEELILKANTCNMGIDWQLAYEELRNITIKLRFEAQERG